jgi:hypothetical protein
MNKSWYDLADHFCARRTSLGRVTNPYFEQFSIRRYNYARSGDQKAVRLIFLKGVEKDPRNRTLVRNGRFIWCRNLAYEGTNDEGLRQVSFTIGNGKKRFTVTENLVLCLPSSIYIHNNAFMRNYDKIFSSFSSIFRYEKSLRLMLKSSPHSCLEDLVEQTASDSPYKVGSLVNARIGYFMPDREKLTTQMHDVAKEFCRAHFCTDRFDELVRVLTHYHQLSITPETTALVTEFFLWYESTSEGEHPYGIILGRARESSGYAGRELYRVNFGGTIYEKVHPVQMEVVSEI